MTVLRGGGKSAQARRERAGGNVKKNVNLTPEVWHSAGLLDTAKGPPEEMWETCYNDVLSLRSCFSTN